MTETTDSTWLTPAEVGELTGYHPNSYKRQCKRLAQMGVPFTPNGVGRPLVERKAVLKAPRAQAKQRRGPNWEAINGTAA